MLAPIPQAKSLFEVAKEIFADVADEDAIEESYRPHGPYPNGYPAKAKKHFEKGKHNFYHANDNEFHVDIALDKNHTFDNPDSITNDDLKAIRPIFATEYLKQAGIANTSETLKMTKKLMPINVENIELRTKKQGYFEEQLVIKQNVTIHNEETERRRELNSKSALIKDNFRQAWEKIDEEFPTSRRKKLPKPYRKTPGIASSRAMSQLLPSQERCPTTLKKYQQVQHKKQQKKNPFKSPFTLIITRHEAERYANLFLDRFDFQDYLKCSLSKAKQCIDFLKESPMARIIYHMCCYAHALFVAKTDDLTNYIRLRALWTLLTKETDNSKQTIKFLSVALMMVKSSVVAIFGEHIPSELLVSYELMESTLFDCVDRILNPYQIFDSLEKGEDFRARHAKALKVQRDHRSINDIIKILNEEPLDRDDEKIARAMMDHSMHNELLYLLGTESWGDVIDGNHKKSDESPYFDNGRIQRLIAMDIKEINKKVPGPTPQWMKKKTLVHFNT